AKSVAEPFAFAEYRKQKLRAKIDLKREKVVYHCRLYQRLIKILPRIGDTERTLSILKDPRFRSLFTNPDMQIDVNRMLR
ncbi:unnamed protein product, partial [Rotaria socialis]